MSTRCCILALMMQSEADYQASLDNIWRKLRPHLEWTQGFVLAVLFTRHHAPVNNLSERLQGLLSLNTLPLRKFELQQPEQLEAILTAVLSSRPLDGKRPPLWVEMWRDSGNEAELSEQRSAVWQVLSRLNERRFLLERDVACPLVLILSAELRMDIPSMMPDLWSVRSYTADLPAPPITPQQPIGVEDYAKVELATSRVVSIAELEWQRLWEATPDKWRLTPETGFAAAEAALARMDHVAAQAITEQLLQLPRMEDTANAAPQALRLLSIALDFSGQVAQARGRLEEARAAYAESLALRRRLRETLGDAPQTLRDLSVSLNNVGKVDEDLGRLEEARAAYAESLALLEQLSLAFPQIPRYQEVLAVVKTHLEELNQAPSEQHIAKL